MPTFRPSPELLFHFDDNLRQAFEQETELFFDSIIRENRSVLDLLDADYTFLNERLAKHYGIPGVYGERFRRVALPADSVRRGLLGQGSILTDTSRAESDLAGDSRQMDSREYLRHAAAAAAAERAGAARKTARAAEGLPMREQMAQHRANPGLRSLPRADGPAGIRAGELRRDRRVARHRPVGRSRSTRRESFPTARIQRPGGAPQGAAEPLGRLSDDDDARSC